MKSRKAFAIFATAATVSFIMPTTAYAESYDVDDSDHPARYFVYPIHAIGKGVEYLVTRPIHALASRPKFRYIFGKNSTPRNDDYWGDPDLYERYSY